jgi:uncharacterized protein YcbK (DUF882 family)
LLGVNKLLAEKVAEIISILEARFNCQVEVVQGFRTFAEQNALYAQGRTKAGNVITKAKAGQSFHNFGLAVDLCKFVNGKPDWNDEEFWLNLRNLARNRGLISGYDWKFQDKPHVQLGNVLPKTKR